MRVSDTVGRGLRSAVHGSLGGTARGGECTSTNKEQWGSQRSAGDPDVCACLQTQVKCHLRFDDYTSFSWNGESVSRWTYLHKLRIPGMIFVLLVCFLTVVRLIALHVPAGCDIFLAIFHWFPQWITSTVFQHIWLTMWISVMPFPARGWRRSRFVLC